MQATWKFDRATIARWKQLVESNRLKDLPRARQELNVRRVGIDLSSRNIWLIIVACQITTQQKSGPGSKVDQFLRSGNPVLNPNRCRDSGNLFDFIYRELTKAGLRRAPTVARNLVSIWTQLESGEWKVLKAHLGTLRTYPTHSKESFVVEYLLSGKYPGLGQKQARNFIQWIGLSRYQIPIDSRVLKRMREFGANFVPAAGALSDPSVYLFLQGALQVLAQKLDIYPCVLDACIFASFDD